MQERPALNVLKLGPPQLLGYLPPERIFRMLTRQDVTAREVPYVRIPLPPRPPVAQQHLICPDAESRQRGDAPPLVKYHVGGAKVA